MFGLVQPDRWLCPTCLVTEVPEIRTAAALQWSIPGDVDAAMHAAIVRVQQLHAREHAAERHLPTAGAR